MSINSEKDAIYHRISSYSGQNGSPILCTVRGQCLIAGIHKGMVKTVIKGEEMEVNTGRLVTAQLISTFRKEARRMKAEKFEVWSEKSADDYFDEGFAYKD
jgi:hypothetical protein